MLLQNNVDFNYELQIEQGKGKADKRYLMKHHKLFLRQSEPFRNVRQLFYKDMISMMMIIIRIGRLYPKNVAPSAFFEILWEEKSLPIFWPWRQEVLLYCYCAIFLKLPKESNDMNLKTWNGIWRPAIFSTREETLPTQLGLSIEVTDLFNNKNFNFFEFFHSLLLRRQKCPWIKKIPMPLLPLRIIVLVRPCNEIHYFRIRQELVVLEPNGVDQ